MQYCTLMALNINQVPQTTFLGVIVDEKLTWKQHTELVCGNMVKSINYILLIPH